MSFWNLVLYTVQQVVTTLSHNWPFLLISAVIAALLKAYMDPQRVTAFLQRYRQAGMVAATAAAVGTPLCSCGTTAVILGMMAGMLPWAPIVAFMVASPLTSPQELVYSAGLFGWPFALTFFAASIAFGLVGGAAASILETRGWLKQQARLAPACGATCAQSDNAPAAGGAPRAAVSPRMLGLEIYRQGRRLLVMFLGFAFIGYFLNNLIPAEWVGAVFGSGHVYSVPLAATLGLPLYVNTEASLPLVRALLDAGMSQGAALAFLLTGAGTSFGAVAGMLTIARWRVISLVVATLWVGAIVFGFAFDAALALGVL